MDLSSDEVKALIAFAAFIFFWSFILIPSLQSWIQSIPSPDPLLFYPLFNIVYLLLFSALVYLLLLSLGGRVSLTATISQAFRYGLAGFILLWMIPDIVAPPYLITREGELLTAHPLWPTVGDAFWYFLLQPYIPKEWMYTAVYIAIPIMLFLIVALLVTPKTLAKLVKNL
ncbi:MAG: hypothetical protein QXD04_03550 [Candidatus Bathyarchaeia archaeon]